jgi:predicted nucleotidyltransferase
MGDRVSAEIEKAAAIFKDFGAREVYLFGSSASGAAGSGSDVDMAVSGLPPQFFFRAMSRACDILRRPLDLVDLDEDTLFSHYLKEKGELLRVA